MQVSQYLSPEPLLQEPIYVRGMAQQGMTVPTYAYAFNNPVRWTDATGLKPGDKFETPDEAAKDALEWLRKNKKKKQLRDYEWCGQIRRTADNQCVADIPKRGPLVKPGDNRAVCDVGPMTPASLGDWHNHPWSSEFSDPDINMNRERMYPGYLLGPDGNIMKFTPTIVPGLVPTVDRAVTTIDKLGSVEAY
jgi:hypothetical protein